jgi:hypothetical protein
MILSLVYEIPSRTIDGIKDHLQSHGFESVTIDVVSSKFGKQEELLTGKLIASGISGNVHFIVRKHGGESVLMFVSSADVRNKPAIESHLGLGGPESLWENEE